MTYASPVYIHLYAFAAQMRGLGKDWGPTVLRDRANDLMNRSEVMEKFPTADVFTTQAIAEALLRGEL